MFACGFLALNKAGRAAPPGGEEISFNHKMTLWKIWNGAWACNRHVIAARFFHQPLKERFTGRWT